MRDVAIVLLALWLVFLIGWIGAMFYAGEVILLPPSDMERIEWSVAFAAMYILPAVSALLFLSGRRASLKGQGPNA